MKFILPIVSAMSLASICLASPNYVTSCLNGPVAVSSTLVIACGADTFDFGHDIHGKPANPLPPGGSLTLKSLLLVTSNVGNPEWDLDFGFPKSAVGKTTLDYSIFGAGVYGGVNDLALGRSVSPFLSQPPNDPRNTPNESGTNFLVTESVTNLAGFQYTLSVCGGNNFSPCLGSLVNQAAYEATSGYAFGVATTITDRVGDLTGFDEGFATPEPASWMLLAGGLFAIFVLRRASFKV